MSSSSQASRQPSRSYKSARQDSNGSQASKSSRSAFKQKRAMQNDTTAVGTLLAMSGTPSSRSTAHSNGDDCAASGSQFSQSTSSKPKEIAFTPDTLSLTIGNTRAHIQQICVNYLWPKLKFVDRKHDLHYSTKRKSICYHVMANITLEDGVNREEWWHKHSHYVLSSMTSLRGNQATAIQKVFFGKLVFSTVLSRLSTTLMCAVLFHRLTITRRKVRRDRPNTYLR